MNIYLTNEAKKQLGKLEQKEQKRIISKIRWLSEQKDPLHFSKQLTGFAGLYRFRVGDYRLVFRPENKAIYIIYIDKRDSVYKSL